MASMLDMQTPTVQFEGESWYLIGVGVRRDDKVFCHLANTTRTQQQKNGKVAIQINDWVSVSAVPADRLPAKQTERLPWADGSVSLPDIPPP